MSTDDIERIALKVAEILRATDTPGHGSKEQIPISEQRRRVTKLVDPDGRTWHSFVVSRQAQVLGLAAVLSAVTLIAGFAHRWFGIPSIREQIEVMDAKTLQNYVRKPDYDRMIAVAEGRWQRQEDLNAAIKSGLDEQRADIKLILQKVR